jgi:hypothetical protein
MIAPTPSDVNPTGPSTRRRRLSPIISACSISSDLVANNFFQNMQFVLGH